MLLCHDVCWSILRVIRAATLVIISRIDFKLLTLYIDNYSAVAMFKLKNRRETKVVCVRNKLRLNKSFYSPKNKIKRDLIGRIPKNTWYFSNSIIFWREQDVVRINQVETMQMLEDNRVKTINNAKQGGNKVKLMSDVGSFKNELTCNV